MYSKCGTEKLEVLVQHVTVMAMSEIPPRLNPDKNISTTGIIQEQNPKVRG